ncbi:MAG: DUF2285 domain-containing protein [Burkholderiales bacterium]|nr:DUF2285 domain-containing protein [Nitrosomonas sp.]MCP5276540.1 DUF2285 domain-containing protein [Burkholderiales bacterium]
MKQIDWRVIENYPGLSKDWWNCSSRWAWEFMRRNHEYETARECWRSAWGNGLYPSDEAYQVRRNLANRWGVTCHMSCWPESDDPLGWQNLIWGLHSIMAFSGADAEPDSPRRTGEQWEEFLQVRRSEVWVRFDLEEKLDNQLKATKKYLTNVREYLEIAPPKHRLRKAEKLQQYLRVWDATQTGTPRDEIAKELYPEMSNEYPEFSGSDQVRKDLSEANKLIDFGFLALKIKYPEANSTL